MSVPFTGSKISAAYNTGFTGEGRHRGSAGSHTANAHKEGQADRKAGRPHKYAGLTAGSSRFNKEIQR